MPDEETFIDERHEYRLRRFADRVAALLRSAGFSVLREDSLWENGGVKVSVNNFRDAPGVFVSWHTSVAWHREVAEHVVAGDSDHRDVQRYRRLDEVMEQTLARVFEIFGLNTHYHVFKDWAGLEVRDPAEEQETP
jgi:hypothetical protein